MVGAFAISKQAAAVEMDTLVKAAADIGDVVQIQSIAEDLKSESSALAPFCE